MFVVFIFDDLTDAAAPAPGQMRPEQAGRERYVTVDEKQFPGMLLQP